MLRFSKVRLILLSVITILLLLPGCSSSKKGGKTSIIKRSYHDITARNNRYFNAKEKLKLTQRNIEETYQEDYEEILPVYADRDVETAKGYNAELDEIIKKASITIRLHAKQVEDQTGQDWRNTQSRWGDNSYLVIGQAYYLKGDFDAAKETFQYIAAEYKKLEDDEEKASSSSSKVSKKKRIKQRKKKAKKKKKQRKKALKKKKKKKKKGKKPKTSKDKDSKKKKKKGEEEVEEEEEDKVSLWDYLQHQKSRPKAMIWLMDSYTALGEYKKAQTILTLIEAEEDFPAMLSKDLEAAKANLYLERGDLVKALGPLNELTSKIKRKRKKVRYEYILAQVNEKLGNTSGALDQYKKVLKSRPSFEMEFNAKMSIARIAKDQNGSYEEVKKMLTKLLKDGKNSDFYDQIHYALAELELEQGNKDLAIENLEASVEKSTTNTDQKALSYLKLAELSYADTDYVTSQAYYDSTVAILSSEHPSYFDVQARNNTLKELVKHLNTIEVQDSLQAIAAMTPEARDEYLENIIKEKQQEENKKKRQEEDVQNTPVDVNNNNNNNKNNNNSGDWYFYNTAARSTGFNDFKRLWGNRKHEDNWRRSDKSSLEEELAEENNEQIDEDFEDSDLSLDELDKEKQALLQDVPLTDKDLEASNDKIIEAYYALGGIYRIQLNAKNKAIESFESLLTRFPENDYQAECYYNLYLLYAAIGDQDRADYYKDLLLNDHPNSTFAKIIKDPDYLKNSKKDQEKIADYYNETYKLYLIDSLEMVFNRIAYADSLFEDNYLQPKFDLLYAFAIGKTDSLEGYISALRHVTETYPGDEVEKKADEILTYLKKNDNKDYEIKINATKYDYNENAIHYVLVTYSSETIKSNDLKIAIAKFNDVNRSLDNLKVNSLVLNDTHTIIRVTEFNNMKQALNYYNTIKASETAFENIPTELLDFMVISDINFNKVISGREIDSYLDFFNVRYIKQ